MQPWRELFAGITLLEGEALLLSVKLEAKEQFIKQAVMQPQPIIEAVD